MDSFAHFLQDTLGLDTTGFLNWLGYIFDFDMITKTQKVSLHFDS
jgi:hypothetical protein